MHFDRGFANDQSSGNLAIPQALGHAAEDFALAIGESLSTGFFQRIELHAQKFERNEAERTGNAPAVSQADRGSHARSRTGEKIRAKPFAASQVGDEDLQRLIGPAPSEDPAPIKQETATESAGVRGGPDPKRVRALDRFLESALGLTPGSLADVVKPGREVAVDVPNGSFLETAPGPDSSEPSDAAGGPTRDLA